MLRVKARGQRDLLTVVGHAASISAGEWVQMSGTWVNDRTHGLQFKAAFLKATPPTTLEGIERYLGSGMIRGIGPVYARKLVRAFGEAVFELIEQEPARLREVTGIGPKRASRIVAGWAEQAAMAGRGYAREASGGAPGVVTGAQAARKYCTTNTRTALVRPPRSHRSSRSRISPSTSRPSRWQNLGQGVPELGLQPHAGAAWSGEYVAVHEPAPGHAAPPAMVFAQRQPWAG